MDRAAPSQTPEELGTVESLPAIQERPVERRAAARSQASPRLSVAHLLLWIACSAAFLAAVRKLNALDSGGWGLALAAAGALGYGAAWTGACLWTLRCVRGETWPVAPGHWLLVVLGVRFGLETVLRLWLSPLFPAPEAMLDAVTVCCLTMPLASRSLSFAWQACFALLLLLYAWPLLASVLDGLIFLPGWVWRVVAWTAAWQTIVLALVVGAFMLIELPERRQHGWLHWAGLGVCAWLALVSCATT